MPNIPPRGLPARHASLWKNPSEVHARVAGAWKSADYVWGRQAGAWQLLWARTAGSPASATAAYTPSQVVVNWVPATPAIADAYKILRPDQSVAGIVNAPATTFTDPDPIPVNGAYSVVGVLAGTDSTVATATNVLDLRLQVSSITSVVNSNGEANSSVTINWAHNAVGAPETYQLYRNGAFLATVAGSATTYTDTAPPRGSIPLYELWSYLGAAWGPTPGATQPSVGAAPPVGLSLTALTSPLSTLRLQFSGPGQGGCTGFRIERYVASTGPWTYHESNDCSDGISDWSTTVAGYMRVRTESAGGPSSFPQVGPVTPTNDITGPGPSSIASWTPESSYGRLVVRGYWSSAADTVRGQMFYQVNGGSWVLAWDSSAISPGAYFAVHLVTGGSGGNYGVLIRTYDSSGNMNTADAVAYRTLAASPIVIDATDSATWRGSAWRTDGTAGSTGVMHGRTSSGENYGYWFYGDQIVNALSGKTLVSGQVDYCRDGSSQGSSAAIQPQFWLHQYGTKPGGQPALGGSATLGGGVARSGTTGNACALNAQWLPYLQDGSWKGFAVYRQTSNTNDADANSFYMRLYPYQTSSGGKISGRVTLNHLG